MNNCSPRLTDARHSACGAFSTIMAFMSLFSRPPSPVLGKHMTDRELPGEDREDGELEDEGINTKEVKEIREESEEKDEKSQGHSGKREKKMKQRSKRRRPDQQKHHSPSSGFSWDSEHEPQERPTKKKKVPYCDHDGEQAQRENECGGPPRSTHHKSDEQQKYRDKQYEYDEEEDFSEQLSKYKHAKESSAHSTTETSKDQSERPIMKGQQKPQQQLGGQRGRGRGIVGRGRGMPNKNKKQKGKNWGRGRGRGGEQGAAHRESRGLTSFQKRRPIMSQEFLTQHTVEHNGRHICKYFIGGRCIKGDECKFEHDSVPVKKKELCKFYVQGYCTKGDDCIYMHSEFPCKFFHTGAQCYQGDNCKFSHEPLTDVTRGLLQKILNTDEQNVNEDEMEDLRKQGLAALPKPPPGVKSLPSPGPGSPPDESKQIPFLSEINVQPAVDLAQMFALRPNFYNSTSPPAGQFQGACAPELLTDDIMSSPPNSSLPPPPGSAESSPLSVTGAGGPQSPPGQPPPQGFGQCPPLPGHPGQPPSFQPPPDMHMNMPNIPNRGQMSSEIFKNLFSSQSLAQADDEHSDSQLQRDVESSGIQNFLPAVQKDLLLHLNQKIQNQHRETGQNSAPASRENDETHHWCSSDEEEGSRVRDGVGDPHNLKHLEPSSSGPEAHPHPPVSHKPPPGDEEGEGELRERAALIPLDPSPGAVLRDPRCQISEFSHIQVDILQHPAFAHTVVWAPEDLIPLLIPKQEPSVNQALVPLISDTLTSPDPHLVAARLKEGVGKLSSSPDKTLGSRHKPDKLGDPRTHKTLNPRISQSGSLDSKLTGMRETKTGGGSGDPQLQRGSAGISHQPSPASSKLESGKLPPYALHLASSTGAGLESPTTLLGGISLYDPRNHTLLSPKHEHKRSLNLHSSSSPPHSSPSPPTGGERKQQSPVEDWNSSCGGCLSNSPVPVMMPASPSSPVRPAAPAVHSLPIQALAGLTRPAYVDPRQNRPAAGTPQEDEEDKDNRKKDRPLRDVFKTFDPTASPFCQ